MIKSNFDFIIDLSVIVPNAERHIFLKSCNVKVFDGEFGPTKQFKVIKRKDSRE